MMVIQMETQTKVITVNDRKVKECDCYLRPQSVRGFFDIKPHLLLHRAAGFVVSSKELSKLSRLLRQKKEYQTRRFKLSSNRAYSMVKVTG